MVKGELRRGRQKTGGGTITKNNRDRGRVPMGAFRCTHEPARPMIAPVDRHGWGGAEVAGSPSAVCPDNSRPLSLGSHVAPIRAPVLRQAPGSLAATRGFPC